MPILDTLITDRTEADVTYANNLNALGLAGMTAEQKAEYLAGLRGAYNYIDLNRVGQALLYVEQAIQDAGYIFSLPSTPKTNWTVTTIPTPALMTAYLANVAAVRTWLTTNFPDETPPQIPASMRKLDYTGANAIEKALLLIQTALDRITVIEAGMGVQSGTVWSDFIEL